MDVSPLGVHPTLPTGLSVILSAPSEALRLAVGCATANALVPGAVAFIAQDARAIAASVVVTSA